MTVSAVQSLSEVVESKITDHVKVTKPSLSAWWFNEWRKILSEFLSTLLLVLMGCMTCMPMPGFESAVYPALGFGMIVMFNVQMFAHISGAFMNPAVTIASMIFGNTSISLGIAYIVVQCLGGIAGYGLLDALTAMNLNEKAICITKRYPDQSPIQTVGIEAAITGVLILVCCGLWDPINKDKQESVSIKFGLTIVGLVLVGAPFTGASMNPARSLGPALWINHWEEHWIYWVGPILGSVFSTLLYKFIFLQKPKH